MSLQIHPALRALGVGTGGLILLVGGSLAAVKGLSSLAQAGMTPPPAPAAATAPDRDYIADPAAARKRLPLILKQSHGDWNRVPTDDQKMLNSMTQGHGRGLLATLGKAQAKKSSSMN